jgi:radical SAM protein with 4Fe4S-binding SPASM domain
MTTRLSSDLDPTKPEHNVARIEDIGRESRAFQQSFPEGVPYFTFVEFSITDLCNRTCVFCPRYDPKVYPNNNSETSVELYEKILTELANLGWQGLLSFSGFGEPLLHTRLLDLVRLTKQYLPETTFEIVTNGDRLTLEMTHELFTSGLDCLKISLYDGPEQIPQFEEIQQTLNLTTEQFIIRHRFLGPEDNYGLILSNRAGTVSFANLPLKPLDQSLRRQCFFPFYKIMIDYDGRVLLCSHDWIKKFSGGDLKTQTVAEVWTGKALQQARQMLAGGNRKFNPCAACDVDGTLNGRPAFEKWANVFLD